MEPPIFYKLKAKPSSNIPGGISLYYKLTQMTINGKTTIILSFGSKNDFCLNAIIKNYEKPNECYIDRVQKNNACVAEGTLKESGGTKDLVKVALWTIKDMFPHITKFTFKDDSHIECIEGSKEYKLSLSYDYILKYNQTWYQRLFNAELSDIRPDPKQETPSKREQFNSSLKILDEQLYPFDVINGLTSIPADTRSIYERSLSPRDFINNLRKEYKDDYCYKVAKWLSGYMRFLQVRLLEDDWYILRENVPEVPAYSRVEMKGTIRGGYKRNTRRNRSKTNYRIVHHNSESIVGTYSHDNDN